MKKILIVLSIVLLIGCTDSKKSAKSNDNDRISDISQITFPIGNKINAERFIGDVYLKNMIQNESVYNLPQTNSIVFAPRARSSWHTHGGMIVLATGGIGYYQEQGKKAQILRKGDILEIPAGVRHWHGAAVDSWFSQVVIYDSHWSGKHDDGTIVHVSDEEYDRLDDEEYTGRDKSKFGNVMFNRGEKPFPSDNFTGTVYVSNLIGDENAANCPGLHYVTFASGVYNNWHIHNGGQFLIATDGIGYHQIEGEPLQIMHPGDVALCPPGVKHWHGGSLSGEFAHIAGSIFTDNPGVTWLDRISEDEYKALNNVK